MFIDEDIELKEIPGWGDRYSISCDGLKIWAKPKYSGHPRGGLKLVKGKWLKPSYKGKGGYLVVWLHHNGIKTYIAVHRLVALAWIGYPPFEGAEVRHNPDPSRYNNHYLNLMYGTHKENQEDMVRHGHSRLGQVGSRGEKNGGSKLTKEQVVEILQRVLCGDTKSGIAEDFNVSPVTIWRIATQKNWSHVL